MNNVRIQIAPSILAADFACLEKEVKSAQDAGADLIHCDVMDGHFVPNISFGPFVVEAVKRCVSIPLDVHLMIAHPSKYISSFCDAGSDILTVHAEISENVPALLDRIHASGVRTGVAVNPDKSAELFLDYLDRIDQVVIMSVFAGFGGQKFMPEMLDKIAMAYNEAKKQKHTIDIQVDGGINDATTFECAQRGANVFVAGSYVFGSPPYAERIAACRTAARKGAAELLKS